MKYLSAHSSGLLLLIVLYNSFDVLLNDYVTEFEFDNSFQFSKQNYWSNGTGTMKDIDVEIFNSRLLYGITASEKLKIKTGLGYRRLYHFWQDRQSTTGDWGYDREQDYTYIPIIAELKMPIPGRNLNGILKIEYMNKGQWGKVVAFFSVRTEEGFIIKGLKLIEGIHYANNNSITSYFYTSHYFPYSHFL